MTTVTLVRVELPELLTVPEIRIGCPKETAPGGQIALTANPGVVLLGQTVVRVAFTLTPVQVALPCAVKVSTQGPHDSSGEV